MQIGRMAIGAVAAAALAAGSVSPAAARDYGYGGYGGGYYGNGYGGYGGYGGHRHHRDRDGLNAGEVIGIAALIGVVAVLASSASKDKKARTGEYPRNSDRSDGYGAGSQEDAVDACAVAARDKASESGRYAEVVDVETPQSTQDGWSVEGRVEQRGNYRDRSGETRHFYCTVRDGRVAEISISQYPA